jgi:hypothetical protein
MEATAEAQSKIMSVRLAPNSRAIVGSSFGIALILYPILLLIFYMTTKVMGTIYSVIARVLV